MLSNSLPSYILGRFSNAIYFLIFTFVVGFVLPRCWSGIEWVIWKISLGGSTVGHTLRSYALHDFRLSIREKEEGGTPRPLAALFALLVRLPKLPGLLRDLRRIRFEKEQDLFGRSIQNLTEGWRSGMPPPILHEYMNNIRALATGVKDVEQRLQGVCAVANVMYLLGDLRKGNDLAKKNWNYAQTQRTENPELLWMAAYAYFNSTLFMGEFEHAMRLMADHWGQHYANWKLEKKEKLIEKLKSLLTLNPVLAIPRHMILAAAFNGPFRLEKKYWANEDEFERHLTPAERKSELRWAELWYAEAISICEAELISLDFSHAYAGFFFTLLRQSEEHSIETSALLAKKAEKAFQNIGEDSPIVSRYAKFGFQGIYHLVNDDSEEALSCLRRAAEYSALSGNKFADCLFMCCHAVAAQRVKSYLKPETDYYLKESRKLAKPMDRTFYFDLCEAAAGAVCRARGEIAKAERHEERSRNGRASPRILSIFRERTRS